MPTTAPHRPSESRKALRAKRSSGPTERFDALACLDDRVRQAGERLAPVAPGRYIQLEGAGGSLLIALDRKVVRVGRSLAADIHLDDDSVSRRHAVLVMHPSGVRLLDDRSANGTFLNGRRVARADLLDGDVITLGRFVLRYRDCLN
jgi:pSer/pThr/pTyr-binding forkhead associated (FHA) protein